MYELLSGWPPFYTGQPLETYKRILARSFKCPGYFTPWAEDLVERLLTVRQRRRRRRQRSMQPCLPCSGQRNGTLPPAGGCEPFKAPTACLA